MDIPKTLRMKLPWFVELAILSGTQRGLNLKLFYMACFPISKTDIT